MRPLTLAEAVLLGAAFCTLVMGLLGPLPLCQAILLGAGVGALGRLLEVAEK